AQRRLTSAYRPIHSPRHSQALLSPDGPEDPVAILVCHPPASEPAKTNATQFIFQRDLKWRPTFPMLKTLILDDWCLHADLSAVIHFIQHSPNLEKVTLRFIEEFDSSMVTEGDNNLLEGTFSSDHLKMVEIKSLKVDGRINKILKILSACGISLEKINIRQANTSS
uniref:FBD domain-containing protein n=2 Tax=Aegilops tauschii subsp. strangulata TaxID=200361 RepID=A0A453CPJ0_AEGTS